MSVQHEDTLQWYRQFWPWALIALLGFAVVASLMLVYIAVSGADNLVRDDYYKDGLAINRDIDRDRAAQQRHIEAELTVDTNDHLGIALRGKFTALPSHLLVKFMHPILESKDVQTTAALIGADRYDIRLSQPISGRWYVEISDPVDRSWRLRQKVMIRAGQPSQINP